MKRLKIEKAVLVYQGGIANVFQVDCLNLGGCSRNAKRLYQGDFLSAANIARGLAMAGTVVRTYACNMAGDISNAVWSEDLDSMPFSDKFIVIHSN